MVRAPDPCCLPQLLQLFFFFTNHNCSHPEVRILIFSKSHSIPSATTQKHPDPLNSHLSAFKSRYHFFPQSLSPLKPNSHKSGSPNPNLHSTRFNWCCCWILIAVNDLGWEKRKWWCRWRAKHRWGRRKKERNRSWEKKEKGRKIKEEKEKGKVGKKWKWMAYRIPHIQRRVLNYELPKLPL